MDSKHCCDDMREAVDENDVTVEDDGRHRMRLFPMVWKEGELTMSRIRSAYIAFCPWCGKEVGEQPEKGQDA